MPPGTADSPLGFNHAYPWQFLVRLARQAGIVWWRDWSAKWQTVEPEKGQFDWTVADEQINRVRELDSEVDVLLPFPSAALEYDRPSRSWSSKRRVAAATAATSCRWRLRPRI